MPAPASGAEAPDPPGTAQVSSVPVTALSLSPDRLTDNDARPVGGTSVPGTYSTRVTTTNPHTGVGPTGTVHRPTNPASVHGSGTTTAYLAAGTSTAQEVTWVLRTPHGSTTLAHAAGDRWFSADFDGSTSLSGNRFLYTVQRSVTSDPRAYVFDASTGRRTLVQRQVGYAAPVVFGDFVVSLHADGSVWRRDLVSGARVQLSDPTALPVNYGELFAWGDYVGWNIDTGDDDEGTGPSAELHAYRDAKTMAPAHSLDRPVQQLSSAGVVLRTDHLSESNQPTAYDLETYDGTTVPLLASDTYRLGPQVDGRAMAWADPTGLLKIAQLDVPVAAPRYLGAPYIPTTRINDPTTGHYWTATLPFSAPVSDCDAVFSRNGKAVLRLGCGAVNARYGEATIAWNAVGNTGRRVPAGTYRYQVTALASDQHTPGLDADGDIRPVTGTILVGHATRTVLHAVPARIRHGSVSVLSAHLTTTRGSRRGHRNVSFFQRLADRTWHRIGTRKTSAAGTARLRVRPGSTAVYRAQFAGSRVDRPSTSSARAVRVHR